ncbi:unnamed protein product [Closterium sp. Yama58-4]|nr:unnamed protein product [Closterium sp. Yama58-4]
MHHDPCAPLPPARSHPARPARVSNLSSALRAAAPATAESAAFGAGSEPAGAGAAEAGGSAEVAEGGSGGGGGAGHAGQGGVGGFSAESQDFWVVKHGWGLPTGVARGLGFTAAQAEAAAATGREVVAPRGAGKMAAPAAMALHSAGAHGAPHSAHTHDAAAAGLTSGGSGSGGDGEWSVLKEFRRWRKEDPTTAVAVAAVKALTAVIERSEATTVMGLEVELRRACDDLKRESSGCISLRAACDIFLCFVSRTSVEADDLPAARARLIERGQRFSGISLNARRTIAMLGQEFITDGCVILTHGFSQVVLALLSEAAARGKFFSVIATEGRMDAAGQRMAAQLQRGGVPVTVVVDAAMGVAMERCDMVLCGAEGVVESGGVLSAVGVFPLAMVAKAMGKPFYVAAESYKFARMFPLDQNDWEQGISAPPSVTRPPTSLSAAADSAAAAGVVGAEAAPVGPKREYAPPHVLTLLFTDLGVLTPAAVSDELIQLYL